MCMVCTQETDSDRGAEVCACLQLHVQLLHSYQQQLVLAAGVAAQQLLGSFVGVQLRARLTQQQSVHIMVASCLQVSQTNNAIVLQSSLQSAPNFSHG